MSSTLLQILLPILLLALLALMGASALAVVEWARHLKNRHLALAAQCLAVLTGTLVRSMADTVRSSKLAGTWSQTVAAAVKKAVVQDLCVLGARWIVVLRTAHSPAELERLLGQLVEDQVEQLRRRPAVGEVLVSEPLRIDPALLAASAKTAASAG